jgi:hypothetical protein
LRGLIKNLPYGKIEGVALRGQITLKELAWSEKQVSSILRSAIEQKVQLKFAGKIKSVTADKKVKITKETNQYYLVLPEKQDVSINILLK